MEQLIYEPIIQVIGIFLIWTGFNFKLFYSKACGKSLETKLDLLIEHFGLKQKKRIED